MKDFSRFITFFCTTLVLVMAPLIMPAQNRDAEFQEIKGRVFDYKTKKPLARVQVNARGNDPQTCYTKEDGYFVFPALAAGSYKLVISSKGYEEYAFDLVVSGFAARDLGTLYLVPETVATGNPSEGSDNAEMDYDTDVDVQDVSSVLSSYQDVFANMASYNFSQVRFKLRGYDADAQSVYMNGLKMNDMNTGSAIWSLWGGLNDATRNQESSVGLESGSYAFGNIGGTTNLDMYASTFRPSVKFTYSFSNRTYANRAMFLYSTGLGRSGWAFAFVGSRRWGEHGYAAGTFYDAWSYFASLEKRFADGRHVLNLVAFGAPTKRGVASGSTREAYALTGNNQYNPNLGYQAGKLRNNRVRDNHEPVVLLNWKWNINDGTRLTVGLGYRWGRNGYSALNWYDAPDPRTDYYRNFPSYYPYNDPDNPKTDPNNAWLHGYYTEGWRDESAASFRYIDYDKMYNVNYMSREAVVDAAGNVIASGLRSKYVIEDRRTDQRQFTANVMLNKEFSTHVRLDAALDFRTNRTAYFKTIKDLMGGEFWYDIDQYAERDFGRDVDAIQSDLNHPYRIVRKGDKFGYDYYARLMDAGAWARVGLQYAHWEAYLGVNGGYNTFCREGNMRKGLFPNNSYGKSARQHFLNMGAKAGFTYKFSGWHYLSANAAFIRQAPNFQDAYISPRTRNTAVYNLAEERIFSADLNYLIRSPYFRMRITGFATRILNQSKIISFYDDYYRSFGNYTMTGIDRQYLGAEVGAEYKVTPTLTLEAAACYGDYTYVSNPWYVQTVDNTAEVLEESRVYWSGYKVSGTPQSVAGFGIKYNAPRYFYGGISANYFGYAWIDMNPTRRTDRARAELAPMYVSQERFDDGFTVDAFIGLSYRLRYKYYLNLNFNVSNILNDKNIYSGGYEHMRISRDANTQKMTRPFDSRIFYAWGRTFFLNLSFRF